MSGFQGVAFTKHYSPLNDVSKLTDIAGPIIAMENGDRFLADVGSRLPIRFCPPDGEHLRQRKDIRSTFGKRGHLDLQNGETVVDILTQCSRAKSLIYSAVGGRKNPNIDGPYSLGSDSPEFPSIENVEKAVERISTALSGIQRK